jgi:hypothetical protein
LLLRGIVRSKKSNTTSPIAAITYRSMRYLSVCLKKTPDLYIETGKTGKIKQNEQASQLVFCRDSVKRSDTGRPLDENGPFVAN